MAETSVTKRFDPRNPNSYRTFHPFFIPLCEEHGPFQRLYDVHNALSALATTINRGRSSIVDEMPDETEQSGWAFIIEGLARQLHDCAAWIEDNYEPKGKDGQSLGTEAAA